MFRVSRRIASTTIPMKAILRSLLLLLVFTAWGVPSAQAEDAAPAPAPAPAPAAASGAFKINIDRAAYKDFTITPALLDLATTQKLALGGNNKLQNGAQKQAYGYYVDALVTSLNPDAKTSAGLSVADAVLTQTRDLIAPGHEPNAGCGLDGWTHHAIAQAFVLIKNTPEVWSKLTDEEKSRMDWIMKAMAVAGHFGYDDQNDYHTSLHTDDNSYKGWNPNHRLYLLVVIAAAAYFGPDQLNEIYKTFSYDDYMKKFDEYGFTNIKATWTCFDWKPILENGGTYTSPKKHTAMGTGTGVKHDFTYMKSPLTDLPGMFCSITQYNYNQTVTNGVDGKSYILNNGVSPFLGQPGMFQELNSHDAEGIRSDMDYCNEDFCAYTTMMMTLRVLGLWPDTPACKNLEKMMYTGNEDFLYKDKTGFHSFSHGKGRDTKPMSEGKWSGFNFVLDIWNNSLKDALKPK